MLICYFFYELFHFNIFMFISGIIKIQVEEVVVNSAPKKKFNCPHCSYGSNQKCNLRAHLFTHSEEKPFECYICQKKFRLKHHLQGHQLTHTGEKPYDCYLCGKLFRTKSQLKSHASSCIHKNL